MSTPLFAADPGVPVDVVIFNAPSTCTDQDVIQNIIADVDDLPVIFHVISVNSAATEEIDPIKTNDEALEIMGQNDANAAFWFSCKNSQVHMVSALEAFPNRERTVQQEEGRLSIEAATAVVRNWLEAMVPKWQLISRTPPPPPTPEIKTIVDEEISTVDLNELQPPKTPPKTTLENTWPNIFNIELGGRVDVLNSGKSLPGGYVTLSFRANKFITQLGAGALKSAYFQDQSSILLLKKYPLTLIGKWAFPAKTLTWELGLGVEVGVYRRFDPTHETENQQSVAAQFSFLGTGGFSWQLFSRVCFVFNAGFRFITRRHIFVINKDGQNQNIYRPWRMQPIFLAGLRVGIF